MNTRPVLDGDRAVADDRALRRAAAVERAALREQRERRDGRVPAVRNLLVRRVERDLEHAVAGGADERRLGERDGGRDALTLLVREMLRVEHDAGEVSARAVFGERRDDLHVDRARCGCVLSVMPSSNRIGRRRRKVHSACPG